MKNAEQILKDITALKEEKTKKGKPKPNKKKIKTLVELIKIVNVMTHSEVEAERKKLRDKLTKVEAMFPEFLLQFSEFQLKNKESHEIAVRKRFNSDFEVKNLKDRITNVNYLLK